jgi:hypothetical protein
MARNIANPIEEVKQLMVRVVIMADALGVKKIENISSEINILL